MFTTSCGSLTVNGVNTPRTSGDFAAPPITPYAPRASVLMSVPL